MQPTNAGTAEIRGPATSARGTRYESLQVRNFLRQEVGDDGHWGWGLHPYEGCELGCTFCSLRLDRKEFGSWKEFERRIQVRTNAVEVLRHELEGAELSGRELYLGSGSDAWQGAEEHFRLTRALLGVLAQKEGLFLKVRTRSSLIARDTDLLREIARRGRVIVTFGIASLDERVNRLLEPAAPSILRRLAALEALARAGLEVGVELSPLMPGLDDEELGLNSLLTRAANAGARFAGHAWLSLTHAQREVFLAHVTTASPALASRFRRVIGRRAPTEDERLAFEQRFERSCASLGLAPVAPAPTPARARTLTPSQLPLFEVEGAEH